MSLILESKPLFLLDGPASNLFHAQAELLKSFEKLLDVAPPSVYTTHSHHLIDVRWPASAYVVKNAALNTSDITDYFDCSRWRSFIDQRHRVSDSLRTSIRPRISNLCLSFSTITRQLYWSLSLKLSL